MKKLYAIFDRIAGECLAMQMYVVMAFRTDEQAARYFADAINDKTSILHKHPADYALIQVGHITDTGTLTPLPEPKHIITGDLLIAVGTIDTHDTDERTVDGKQYVRKNEMPRNLQYEANR